MYYYAFLLFVGTPGVVYIFYRSIKHACSLWVLQQAFCSRLDLQAYLLVVGVLRIAAGAFFPTQKAILDFPVCLLAAGIAAGAFSLAPKAFLDP